MRRSAGRGHRHGDWQRSVPRTATHGLSRRTCWSPRAPACANWSRSSSARLPPATLLRRRCWPAETSSSTGATSPTSSSSRSAHPDARAVLPDANLFGLPAGTYAPAVQDGYYLLFDARTPGAHTIKFGGTGNFGGRFTQDITYRLLVTGSTRLRPLGTAQPSTRPVA